MLIWLELSAAALALVAICAGGAYFWKDRTRKEPQRVEKRTAPRAQPLAGSLGGERGAQSPTPIVAPVVPPPPPPPPPPPSLLAAERQREIRAELSHRLERAGRALPSDEQWKMILTPSTCVRVAAGAGSGKSTTLALRVIVLRYYLGAAWDEQARTSFWNVQSKMGTSREDGRGARGGRYRHCRGTIQSSNSVSHVQRDACPGMPL